MSDFSIDSFTEWEGIEGVREVRELIFDALREGFRVQDALVRGVGVIVDLNDLGADTLLGLELGRGKEEVMQQPPCGGVEVVEERDNSGAIESLRPEPLADRRPVLLFDMGIVVLLVGSGAGALDGLSSMLEVADEMPREELGAVIPVKAEDRKGQRSLDGDDLLKDASFPFAPERSLFGPAGGDVGNVEGEDKRSGHGGVAVRDGIGFEEAGSLLIPLVGLNRDMVLEECAGLGGGEALALNPQPLLGKQPVDGRWGYLRQGLLDPRSQDSEGLLVRFDPAGQDGVETLGARSVSGLPDTLQRGHNLRLAVA